MTDRPDASSITDDQLDQLYQKLDTGEARITAARNLCVLLAPHADDEDPFRLGQAHAARTIREALDAFADGPSPAN